MKKKIHPLMFLLKINCSCGNMINIYSTLNKNFSIDTCYKCHSFYTGKQKINYSSKRISNFNKRFSNIFIK